MISLGYLVSNSARIFCVWVLLLSMHPSFAALPADLDLELVTMVGGNPVAVRHAGDGSGRIFIVGRSGGEYYGWSCMEGSHEYDASRCDGSPMVAPVLEYAHADGGCSITGGYRYRGPIPGMSGLYFYADYCTGNIWYAGVNNGSWSAVLWKATGLNVSSFGEDEAGNLYVVDLNGAIYRFESATSANDCREANEIVKRTVYAGEIYVCIASESIQVQDFTIMDGGYALLLAPEVFFFTDQLNQVSVESGGKLTVSQ